MFSPFSFETSECHFGFKRKRALFNMLRTTPTIPKKCDLYSEFSFPIIGDACLLNPPNFMFCRTIPVVACRGFVMKMAIGWLTKGWRKTTGTHDVSRFGSSRSEGKDILLCGY